MVVDQAVKIFGADPKDPRRDLPGHIKSGDCREGLVGLQMFTEGSAERFAFCTGHVPPGIEFLNDPVLGGPTFH